VDWKRYSGTVLEVNLIKSPRSETIIKNLAEFEALDRHQGQRRGNPGAAAAPEGRDRAELGKPSFDVVHLSYHVQKRQFEKGGWLADLSGF
jgi:multiple sugar transport system substrate-binding protein